MTRLALIGADVLGTSIALGLKKAKPGQFEIVAAAADPDVLKTVKRMGAADRTHSSARKAVEGAEIIILDTPLIHTRDLLEALGPSIEPGAVVTDTGLIKTPVIEWANSFLPKGTHFIAGRPVPKADLAGLKDASAEVLTGAEYCIVAEPDSSSEAVQTLVSLAELCGARPFFLGAREHDTYSAAMGVLPTIISSALMSTTSSSNSWAEMSRVASSQFGDMTRLADRDPEESHAAAMVNPDDLVHWIDQMISSLYAFRNQVKGDKEELFGSFVNAWEQRARWQAGAVHPDDASMKPRINSGEAMAEMMVGSILMDRYRNMTGKSRKQWEYFRKG
jgi:cyclohexadieny/prephenate dehydrogenase